MRAFLSVIVAAGVVASPLPAAPEAPQRPAAAAGEARPQVRSDQPVRVYLVNTPLRQALQHLFRFRPADCLVAVDVPDIPVRAQLSYTTLDEAMDALVKAARAIDPELTLSRGGDRYLLFNAHPFHPEDTLLGSFPKYWALVEPSGHGEEESITADFRDMPLRDVLGAAFRGSGLQYTIDPNVPNLPITLNIRDIRLPALLRLVVRQASVQVPGLEMAKQEEIYVFSIRPGAAPVVEGSRAPAGVGDERKITLDLREIPLREAIALVFKGSGLQYAIDPNVPNIPITLNVRDISIPAALRLIIRQAAVSIPGLTTAKEGDIYLIRIRIAPAAYVTPAAFTGDDPAQQTFTFYFRDTPLRAALAQLFQGTGQEYLVAADVPDVPVTLNIREIARPAVLRLIVRQAAVQVPGLTSGKEGDVYLIRRRPRAAVEEVPPQETPPGTSAADSDLTWEKIPIQFVDAVSLTVLCGGSVMPDSNGRPSPEGRLAEPAFPNEVQSELRGMANLVPPGITGVLGCPRDNSLMVRGTPDDIQAFKNILRLLDIPQRQVVLRVSAGGVTAEGRAANGTRLHLGDAIHDRGFRFTAVPRVNGDGTIDVSIDGTLTLHGTARPLVTHVRVAPGESVTLFTLGEGLGATRVWLRASLAPEPVIKEDE